MRPIPRPLADKFGKAFAGAKVGFSAKEITEYFTGYSSLVRPFDHYGFNPTRQGLFIESLYALTARQQYYALNDLCYYEKPSRYPYPSPAQRAKLSSELHSFISPEPIGLAFSKVDRSAVREDWMIAYSRIHDNPAAAITAARTLLESVLTTILVERGQTPDAGGDLQKLLKQTEDALGFLAPARQAEHLVLSGLATTANGLAALSNAAGDRHGIAAGTSIDDPFVADLCVQAAGAVALFFLDTHLFLPQMEEAGV